MNPRLFVLPLFAAALALTAGCAEKNTVRPAEGPITQTSTGATVPTATARARGNGQVFVADDLARACKIEFNDVAKAPKFDVDQSALLPQDRDILTQVAACVTTGPLKGRGLKLVGRADPRGEVEYNMALGEHRAGSARAYLGQLGVDKGKIAETSRGKLDATGTSEVGWERDRRVDILLQ